jgi:ADP-ribosylation factor related protein 1
MVSQSRLNFWDLGGEAQLQSLWPKYYSQSHALIYVIDAGSLMRLDESIDILNGILEFEEIINISVLIIVNKIDIEGGTSVAEVKERIDAVIGKEREVTVLSASAKEGYPFRLCLLILRSGVVECVEWIHKTVIANTTARPPSKS